MRVTSWTSHDQGFALPVAVFAEVYLGIAPVVNASVMLEVEVEDENGTIFALLPLSMQDDGRGGKTDFYHFLHRFFKI